MICKEGCRNMENYIIQHCKNLNDLDCLFAFMSIHLNFDIKNCIYVQSRKDELKLQFARDKSMLIFIRNEDGDIIAGLSMKHSDNDEITLGMLAVGTRCRRQGIGRKLVEYVENLCALRGYKQISLGARTSSANFYIQMNYEPILMVELFGDNSIYALDEFIRSTYKLKCVSMETGNKKAFYSIDNVDEQMIDRLSTTFTEAEVQFVFTKNI